MHALGLAGRREVPAGELGGGVDRVAAAGAEEDPGVVDRGEAREALGQVERGLVGERAEALVGREAVHLGADRVGDLRAPVPDVHAPEARGAVEVDVAGGVPDAHALRAVDDDLGAADGVHVRERVPEACVHARHATGCSRRPAITGSAQRGARAAPDGQGRVPRATGPWWASSATSSCARCGPVAQQRPRVARVDDLLDAEALGGAERGAHGVQARLDLGAQRDRILGGLELAPVGGLEAAGDRQRAPVARWARRSAGSAASRRRARRRRRRRPCARAPTPTACAPGGRRTARGRRGASCPRARPRCRSRSRAGRRS